MFRPDPAALAEARRACWLDWRAANAAARCQADVDAAWGRLLARRAEIAAAEAAAAVSCPLCWGLGEAVREDAAGRLFCWPCPHGCTPAGAALVRAPRTKGLGRKAARRR